MLIRIPAHVFFFVFLTPVSGGKRGQGNATRDGHAKWTRKVNYELEWEPNRC